LLLFLSKIKIKFNPSTTTFSTVKDLNNLFTTTSSTAKISTIPPQQPPQQPEISIISSTTTFSTAKNLNQCFKKCVT